jgi:hypothetical protein
MPAVHLAPATLVVTHAGAHSHHNARVHASNYDVDQQQAQQHQLKHLQQQHTKHQQHQQQQRQNEQLLSSSAQHAEWLQQVLHLPPHRFQSFIQQAPAIMNFQPHTLQITLEALCEALHMNNQLTLVGIVEQRPTILLAPHEPAITLQQLAQLLGISARHTAALLGKHHAQHLLALSPQQLQQRLQQLAAVMQWGSPMDDVRQPQQQQQQQQQHFDTVMQWEGPLHDMQPAPAPAAAAAAAAAAVVGAPAFLQLLAAPVDVTAQQLTALAAALDASEASCAAVVQHHPQQLLRMQPAVLQQRLLALADPAGISCQQLLQELDVEQSKGIASILLYEEGWIKAQLRGLERVLKEFGKPLRIIVWLLPRLVAQTRQFAGMANFKKSMASVEQALQAYEPWAAEVQQADDKALALLFSASDSALLQLQFLVETGREAECGKSLREVLASSGSTFEKQYGEAYQEWLADRQ